MSCSSQRVVSMYQYSSKEFECTSTFATVRTRVVLGGARSVISLPDRSSNGAGGTRRTAGCGVRGAGRRDGKAGLPRSYL